MYRIGQTDTDRHQVDAILIPVIFQYFSIERDFREPISHRGVVIGKGPDPLDGQVMDAVNETDLFQVGIIGVEFPQEQQQARMPIVQMYHIELSETALLDGFGHRGTEYDVLDRIGIKRLFGIVVVDMGNATSLDLRMMYDVMMDIRELFLRTHLIQLGHIDLAP